MKTHDLEFNQKPGLSLALDMLKALPAEATLQQAITDVANANGARSARPIPSASCRGPGKSARPRKGAWPA